ncbi:unnamed protein product [Paramecium primaurelia]|uniref:Uncharacterized protein n=1 Tax=Paramecium primaurelia TaxID=5886 RepID=A0A8S1JLN5_PARPR|nr:unnamed protein product [Paramecium primaurelia]
MIGFLVIVKLFIKGYIRMVSKLADGICYLGIILIFIRCIYEQSQIQKSGGGVYDKQIGDDDAYFTTKTGMWIELYDEFNRHNQIIFRGEYQNQKKVGVWEKIDLDKGRTIDEMNYYY